MPTTTTHTIKSSGGDYTSLSAWEAAQQGDLVTLDVIRQAECYGFQDATTCTIAGSTVDATRYRRVFAAAGAEARMPFDRTGAAYRITAATGQVLFVDESYVRTERIQSEAFGTTVTSIAFRANSTAGLNFRRFIGCIGVRANSSPAGAAGVFRVYCPLGAEAYVVNCVGYSLGGTTPVGFDGVGAGKTYFYNCTAANCAQQGFSLTTTAIAKNCLVTNCGVDFNGAGSTGTDYNASEDTTAPGANSRISQTFTFVNAAGVDWHLASGDAGAKGFGADLSGDSIFPFSDDFDRVTRTGSWDIGADEVAAVGGSLLWHNQPIPHLIGR